MATETRKCALIVDGQRFPDSEFAVEVRDDEGLAFGFLTGPVEILRKAQRKGRVRAEMSDGTTITFTVLQVSNAGLALIGLDPKLLRS
jgi:hypothetical protein